LCLGVVAVASDREPALSSGSVAHASIAGPSGSDTRFYVPDTPALDATRAFDGIYAVDAAQTPSGFDVPRFVSLKFGRVNARTGPSRGHSVAYQYRRRGLPLIVVAETEMWRKVRDMDGDEAWVRKPALSGERFAVFSADGAMLDRPGAGASVLARVEQGALVKVEDCDLPSHCRIRTDQGLKGFASKRLLWGAQ
ncbi:MAG: SH3 domain-containing protein, partial [Litorimonas sp.]